MRRDFESEAREKREEKVLSRVLATTIERKDESDTSTNSLK